VDRGGGNPGVRGKGSGSWGCGNQEERGREPGCYEAGTRRYRAGYLLKNIKQKVLKSSKSAVVNHLRSFEISPLNNIVKLCVISGCITILYHRPSPDFDVFRFRIKFRWLTENCSMELLKKTEAPCLNILGRKLFQKIGQ